MPFFTITQTKRQVKQTAMSRAVSLFTTLGAAPGKSYRRASGKRNPRAEMKNQSGQFISGGLYHV
jgi:hypothetical protein